MKQPTVVKKRVVIKRSKALERATEMWRNENWAEPDSPEQERLYCLFFTNQEPDEDLCMGAWTRPPRWIEQLICPRGRVGGLPDMTVV